MRVPPHDLEAEGAVLTTVLLDPRLFDELSGQLRQEHFYANANGTLWGAMLDLSRSGRPIDAAGIASWLRDHGRLEQIGGMPYLAAMAGGAFVADVHAHAQRIVGKWRMRQVIGVANAIAAEGYASATDPDEFIRAAEARIYAVASDTSRASRSATVRQVAAEALTELEEKYQRKRAPGLSTGFRSLDRRIGWLNPGCVYVVAARPGGGKTSLASHVMKTVATSPGEVTGVFFASVEMPKAQIMMRMFSQEAGIDTRAVNAGYLNASQWSELTKRASEISSWPMVFDDTESVKISELRGLIRRGSRTLEREYGKKLGIVVIDYAQIMGKEQQRKGQSDDSLFSDISAGVLAIAKEFSVPVMLLAQLNRDCEKRVDKRPQLSDLRSSGAFEQDANSVIFIYRDDMYRRPDEPKDNIAELIVAKSRGGSPGTVKVGFVPRYAQFVDQVDDDPEDEFARIADELWTADDAAFYDNQWDRT